MSRALVSYLAKFREAPDALERELAGCALLVVDGTLPEDESSDYRFRTQSSGGTPLPGHGNALVWDVKKQKNNAFQRGVTLGRTSNNDLVIDAPSISRFHAWFQKDPKTEVWSMADAGSKNGSWIADQRLKGKKPQPLASGARVRFGSVTATFLLPREFLAFIRARIG